MLARATVLTVALFACTSVLGQHLGAPGPVVETQPAPAATQPAAPPEVASPTTTLPAPTTMPIAADAPSPISTSQPATAPAIAMTLPASQPESKPSPPTEATTQPAEPATQATTMPSTHPEEAATQPATQPVTQPATQPVVTETRRADPRPSIVLILADDLPASATGFDGNAWIRTPQLNRLAKQSARFTRCYTSVPQDGPAFASILMGQYPHTHGVTTDQDGLPPGSDTFTTRLERSGYACGIVGRWPLRPADGASPGHGLTSYTATVGDPWSWEDSDVFVAGQKVKAEKYLPEWIVDRAIEFLCQPKDTPFFLLASLGSPREPLAYPPGSDGLYPPASIEPPETTKIDLTRRPAVLRSAPIVRQYQAMNPQQLAEARSKYAAMLTHLDSQVGRILEQLDTLGLQENTIVVFAAENGFALGDHQLFGTGPAFIDPLVRVPLLVRPAGLTPLGESIDRIVSLVDLAPTLLEVAGLIPPITMQGRSLLPLIRDPRYEGHADERFFEFDRDGTLACPVRGVVTRHFKFIDYLTNTDELYDLKRDPQEKHNAVGDMQYTAVMKILQTRVQAWREQTRDTKK